MKLFLENWVLLLVAQGHDQAKNKRRKDLLLEANKESTEDLSQSSVSLNNKIEKILRQGYIRTDRSP